VTAGYPTRAIHYVVPFGPGPTQAQAQWLAQGLGTALGQPVVVENRPGASGMKGTAYVARAPADGYTLLAANPGPLTVGPNVHAPEYDLASFAPIVLMARLPSVLATRPGFGASTIAELVDLARAAPGQIVFGSPGAGTVGHLAMELFQHCAGVRMTHLPREGLPEAIPELVDGRFDLLMIPMSDARPLALEGRIRALATTTRHRAAGWPELPTVEEAGVPAFESFNWNGVAAPANTPREIVERINKAINHLLESDEGRAALEGKSYEVAGGTPEAFGAFLAAEKCKWAAVVRRLSLNEEK
jgi:tripartite-type tricarboxylate transporter receptor subunit TctC